MDDIHVHTCTQTETRVGRSLLGVKGSQMRSVQEAESVIKKVTEKVQNIP